MNLAVSWFLDFFILQILDVLYLRSFPSIYHMSTDLTNVADARRGRSSFYIVDLKHGNRLIYRRHRVQGQASRTRCGVDKCPSYSSRGHQKHTTVRQRIPAYHTNDRLRAFDLTYGSKQVCTVDAGKITTLQGAVDQLVWVMRLVGD